MAVSPAVKQSRTKAHKRAVLGLTGGFYPSIGRHRGGYSGGFPGMPRFKGMRDRSGKGTFQSGSQKGSPTIAAKGQRFIKVEGINWDFSSNQPVYDQNARWPLAGNSVWYQVYNQHDYKSARDDVTEDIALNQARYAASQLSYDDADTRRNIWKFLDSPDPAFSGAVTADGEWSGMGPSMVKALGGDLNQKAPMGGAPGRLVKEVLDEYRSNVGTYSMQLLSTLNKIASEIVKMSLKDKRGTTPREVEVTKGAMMPEEETKAWADGVAPGDMPTPAGRGQTVDTFLRVGTRIVPADVTEMTIADGGHHGISGRIMKEDDIQQQLKRGEKGEKHIKDKIYKYYQDQIRLFNVAVRDIKTKATDTYITSKGKASRPLTPGEMSAPFKTTEYFINNFNQRVSALQGASIHEPKGLGKQVGPGTNRAAWLQNKLNKEGAAALSASVQGIVRKLFRHTKVQTEHRGKVKVTKAIVGFAMHWIRTWDQHKGRIENNLTVSHDPHVTASVVMRMYGPEEARAYEFARLFKEGVRIKHGYVTVHNAIQAGRLKEKNMAAAVFDMKAARLHSFYHKGKTNLMLNQIASTHAQLGVSLQTGFATYIPDILGMDRMERIHQKMLSEDYRLWNTVKVSLGSNWGMTAGPAGQFQNRLRAIQQNALDASSNRQMKEKATWPEKSWLTSMPYMSLLRQG